jgi:signal peptidase II
MSKRTIYIIALIIFNIAIDQISKVVARINLTPYEEVHILGSHFTLNNVENKGAFLGLGSDFNPTIKLILLLVLPVIVLGFVLRMVITDKTLDRISIIGFTAIIGGGIANVYDRIMYGSVTDFLHIDLGGVFKTGIFNVADMSVMFGLGCLLWSNFKNKKEKTQEVNS